MGVRFAINNGRFGTPITLRSACSPIFLVSTLPEGQCPMPRASLLIFSIMLIIPSPSFVALRVAMGTLPPENSAPEARR